MSRLGTEIPGILHDISKSLQILAVKHLPGQHSQSTHGGGGGGGAAILGNVTGPAAQKASLMKTVDDMVERFPKLKALLADSPLKSVSITDSDYVTGADNEKAVGTYDGSSIKMAWRPGEADHAPTAAGSYAVSKSAVGVFRHELGHKLNDVIKAKWKETGGQNGFDNALKKVSGAKSDRTGRLKLTKKAKAVMAKSLSKYASSNGREYFAESFAKYTNPKYAGDLPEPIHAYFEGMLK